MHILHGQTAGLQAEVIVGAVDIAPAHPDMAAAVKIQTVAVIVPVVFNVEVGCPKEIAVQKRCCPRGSIQQPQVLYADIAAAQHPQQHGAVDTARVGERRSVAVNDAAAANCDIFGILGKQKAAVKLRLVAVAVMVGIGAVVGNIGAGQQGRAVGDFQRHIAFQVQRTANKYAACQPYCAAVGLGGVNGSLHRDGVLGATVCNGTKITRIKTGYKHANLRYTIPYQKCPPAQGRRAREKGEKLRRKKSY